jgi:hypothetical protein
MTTISIDKISDGELLERTTRAAGAARHATAELLALIGELDARRLYLGEGCSSLFTYCTQVLHLSEHAAYHRIEAARAARRFPLILDLVADGSVTLTTVAMLRPHLTEDNHESLLETARHKSKREVELLIAGLAPRPDAKALIRRLPTQRELQAAVTEPAGLVDGSTASRSEPVVAAAAGASRKSSAVDLAAASATSAPRPIVAPLAQWQRPRESATCP